MNLNNVLRDAIAKGAVSATRKPVLNLRRDVSELKRQMLDLKRLLRNVQMDVGNCVKASKPEDLKQTRIRPTGDMVKKLRQRLGLTQVELARLISVSSLTVLKWEQVPGRIRLRARTLESLAKAKAMSKTEAKASLCEATRP
ncbi:MAG: helix-turn-helix transcriptional regulator [bacterium]